MTLDDMEADRVPHEALHELAALVPSSQPVDISVDWQAGLEVEPLVRQLGGLAYRIWRDGPLYGSDRSTTLVHLTRLCAEQEFTIDQSMAVLRSADDRWGKGFMQRGEAGREILERIVAKAYS